MSAARTTMTTALSDLSSAREKLNAARASETAVTLDGANSAQGARVMQLQAQIQNIQSNIAKTFMRSPFNGVVTKQEVEAGEIAAAGEVIVSVISDDKLEIESNISEVNIGKIAVSNPVEITLDAYPGETFQGSVSYIDPGETIIDAVVNYKVRIALTGTADTRIKSGLTANLTIETARRAGVLAIPSYAVKARDGKSYVMVTQGQGGVAQERAVELGIVGQDGTAEVLSGLSEDEVIEVGA
jgi:HlyD family secretion protein